MEGNEIDVTTGVLVMAGNKMEIKCHQLRRRNDGEADPGEAICSKMVALTANETSGGGEVEELNCQERLRTEPVSRGGTARRGRMGWNHQVVVG